MHEVRVQRPGGGEAQRVVEAGTDFVLPIEAPGTISGTVQVCHRAAVDKVLVSLRDEATGYERMDWFRGAGGALHFPAVPPGEYTLHTTVNSESVERKVTLSAGETITGVALEVAPNVVVRGTIIDEAGAPIAGLEVGFFGSSEEFVGQIPDLSSQTAIRPTNSSEDPRQGLREGVPAVPYEDHLDRPEEGEADLLAGEFLPMHRFLHLLSPCPR